MAVSGRYGRGAMVLLLAGMAGLTTAPRAAAAETDTAATLQALRAADLRVATISWRLATANHLLCPGQSAEPGVVLYDAAQYRAAVRRVATALFGLGTGVTVAAVVPGSAAARAGLAAGDGIEAVGGVALAPEPMDSKGSFGGIDRATGALERATAAGETTLTVLRGSERAVVKLAADPGCASFVQLVPDNRRRAGADGHTVSISSAIYDQTDSDDELALVIAHEMAHNILQHRRKLTDEKVSKGVFAGLGANGARLRAVEEEADRVGLYLMAQAGYDPAAGARFWTRFGPTAEPVLSDGTHPDWRTRARLLGEAAAEIARKRAAGEPLLPGPPS